MLELINTAPQTVAVNDAVVYNDVYVKGGCAEYHRAGTGTITLMKAGRYKVAFSANVAVPATGAVADGIKLAIAQDGEPLIGTVMASTPSLVSTLNNVSTETYIDVPQCCGHACCSHITIENVGVQAADVENANFIAVRVNG